MPEKKTLKTGIFIITNRKLKFLCYGLISNNYSLFSYFQDYFGQVKNGQK